MKRRWMWFLAIALGVIILFTLWVAPGKSNLSSGSTYSRSPDGYGAWYAFMEKQGTPVKRWQKPFNDLPKSQPPITLLRVNSQVESADLDNEEQKWVEQGGNTLVILGVQKPVTEADFNSQQSSWEEVIKIETRRRNEKLQANEKSRLGDRFGAVVWEQKLGKGRVIFATTPHLGANAYQDEPGNYKFLAQLLTQSGARELNSQTGEKLQCTIPNPILVNEYIHGYKGKDISGARKPQSRKVGQEPQCKNQNPNWIDKYLNSDEVRNNEDPGNWVVYLAKTPLASAFVQAGIILLVLVVAGSRRFGSPLTVAVPVVDNSEAYIQALAGVLHKADSSEFILEVLGKKEQLHLQKSLSLGTIPLDHQTLINSWVQQTGRSAAELEQVLQLQSKGRRISEQELLTWLGKWQTIRRYLPS